MKRQLTFQGILFLLCAGLFTAVFGGALGVYVFDSITK